MDKVIWRGLPTLDRPLHEVEAHYLDVHVPLSRRTLMLDPSQIAYVTLRARRQLDVAGGWNHPVEAWRFITFLEDAEREVPAPVAAEVAALRALLWRDNPLFVRESVRCQVDEEVVVDRRTGRASGVLVLVEIDRQPETPPAAADARARGLVELLAARAADAVGFRLLAFNRVRRQRTQRLRDDGGYDLTDWSAEGGKVAYVELVFDSAIWAEQFMAGDDVVRGMFGDGPTTARAYLVEERCEFDRR